MEKRTKEKSNVREAYIGIDPGVSGGIAMISPDGWQIEKYPASREPDDVRIIFAKMIEYCVMNDFNTNVFIELVHAMPNDGKSNAFKFGMNYGIWLGITSFHTINKVSPQKWQKFYNQFYGQLPKIKKDRKNKLKEYAASIMKDWNNDYKPTLATSDAILIAHYGKEMPIEE